MSFVKQSSVALQSGGSTVAPSIGTVTAGNLLVARVYWASSVASGSPTISASAGWSVGSNPAGVIAHGFSCGVSVFYKTGSSGTNTGTFTLPSSDSVAAAYIEEYSGGYDALDATPVVTNLGASGDVNSGNTGTITTVAANTLLIASISIDTASVFTNYGLSRTTSGYTDQHSNQNNNIYTAYIGSYQEVSSAGAQSCAYTFTNPGFGIASIVAFKASSAGTTYNDPISESVTSGYSIANTHTAVGSVSEAVTPADSYVSAQTFASAISEAITAAFSPASAATFPNTLTASLTLSDTMSAPLANVSIVSTANIKQVWQSGVNWSATSVTVPQAGDAILTFGSAYLDGTLGEKNPPTDNNGTLLEGIDTGRPDPGGYSGYPQPFYTQIYYEHSAAVGSHTITPPNIGDAEGFDGNIWVAVVRGLNPGVAPLATGHFHNVSSSAGTTYPSVTVELDDPVPIGSVIFAVMGYDNDRSLGRAVNFTDPNGWTKFASETDAVTNCPTETFWKIATAEDTQSVTLSWDDPHATVIDASIIAFEPLPGTAYSDSITETITAGYALAAANTMLATLSEAATLADSLNAGLVIAKLLSEAVTPADDLSAQQTAVATLNEAIATGDAYIVQQTLVSLLTEQVSLASAYSAGEELTTDALPSNTYVGRARVRMLSTKGADMNYSPLRVGETDVIGVDFVDLLNEGETILTATWTNSVRHGEDNNPQDMIVGSALINGAQVSTQVTAPDQAGTFYGPKCTITTSEGRTLVLPDPGLGYLRVVA